MNNTILVGIDFSECSINALEHAVSIAQKANCNIVMVWVNKLANDKDLLIKDHDLFLYGAKQRFAELLEKYTPVLGEGMISYKIEEGRVHEGMAAACKEFNPFLVVIGTHGVSGFSEKWAGSNAYHMAMTLDTPLITIRGGVNIHKTISKIVLPIDNSLETRQKLPITIMIAKYFGAQVNVLAVYTSEYESVKAKIDSYVKQVTQFLASNDIPFVIDEMHNKSVAEGLIEYAGKIEANLISIMDEQEKTASNFFLGSFTEQLITNSPFPLLISHSKNVYSSIARN